MSLSLRLVSIAARVRSYIPWFLGGSRRQLIAGICYEVGEGETRPAALVSFVVDRFAEFADGAGTLLLTADVLREAVSTEVALDASDARWALARIRKWVIADAQPGQTMNVFRIGGVDFCLEIRGDGIEMRRLSAADSR